MATSRIDPTIALSSAIRNLQTNIDNLEKVNCLLNYLEKKSNDLQTLNKLLPECKESINTLLSLDISASNTKLVEPITLIVTAIDEPAGKQLTKDLAWTLPRNKLTYCYKFLNNWIAQLEQFQKILDSWNNLSSNANDLEKKSFPKVNRLRNFIDIARNQASSHIISLELDNLLQSVITAFNDWKLKEMQIIADTFLTQKNKKNAWLNSGHIIGGVAGLGVCTTLAITYPPAACALWALYALCILGAVISSWVVGAIVKSYRASTDSKVEMNTDDATHSSSLRNPQRVSPTFEDDPIPTATEFNFGHIIGAMIGVIVFLTVLAPCLPTTLAEYCIYGVYLAAPIILGALGVGGAVNYFSDSNQDGDEYDTRNNIESDEEQIDGRKQTDDYSPIHSPRSLRKQNFSANLSNGDDKDSLPSLGPALDDTPDTPLSRQQSKSDLQSVSSFRRPSPLSSQNVESGSNGKTHSRTPSG